MLGASICFFLAAVACFAFVLTQTERSFRLNAPVESDEPGTK